MICLEVFFEIFKVIIIFEHKKFFLENVSNFKNIFRNILNWEMISNECFKTLTC